MTAAPYTPPRLPPGKHERFREVWKTIVKLQEVESRLSDKAHQKGGREAFELRREADFVRTEIAALWREIDAIAESRRAA